MRKRSSEGGFALLLVFVFAASIAIFLYMQLPRVAFEAQREKEQTLVDVGEQYKRAIGLFVKKNGGKYPTKIEDLENFNNVRYLRRRYKDPMTGKDEWRLIHVGPGGVLIDSINSKKKNGEKDGAGSSTANQFITEMPGVGQSTTNGVPSAVNRRRASDMPGAAGQMPDQGGSSVPTDPNNPGNANAPLAPPGMNVAQGNSAYPSPYASGRAAQGNATGNYPSGYGPTGSNNSGVQAYGQGYSGAVSGSVPRGSATTGNNQALDQIRNMLANPRPVGVPTPGDYSQTQTPTQTGGGGGGGFGGSLPSSPSGGLGSSSSFGSGGQVMGAQIAGIASKYEGDSIKIYNDRQKFNEWEFIYDPAKDKSRGLAQSMNGALPNGTTPMGGSSNNNNNNSFGGGTFNNNNNNSGSFGGSGSSFGNGPR